MPPSDAYNVEMWYFKSETSNGGKEDKAGEKSDEKRGDKTNGKNGLEVTQVLPKSSP